MRLALIGLVTAVAALAANVQPGSAQFNKRYCTQGGGPGSSGELDCSFNTWEQCVASASGLGRYCTENPAIGWAKRGYGTWQESPQPKSRRQRND